MSGVFGTSLFTDNGLSGFGHLPLFGLFLWLWRKGGPHSLWSCGEEGFGAGGYDFEGNIGFGRRFGHNDQSRYFSIR
jgi:hypothetical protein